MTSEKKHRRIHSRGDVIFDCVIFLITLLLVVGMCYPFLNILAISFNDVTDTMYGLRGILPRQFTLANYKQLLSNSQIYIATGNSILRTVFGTVYSLVGCTLSAYLVYHKKFILRKLFAVVLLLSMYLDGGMIANFLLMKELHLIDTFFVYILPNFVFPFNAILILNYMKELPESIIESANLDGANDLQILFQIIVPLSLPILATVALFCAVGQWSSWFDVMLYNGNNSSLSTLQYELQKKLAASANTGPAIGGGNFESYITPEAVRATMTIIATVPILLVYPFVQKYFVKGITLGGVKG